MRQPDNLSKGLSIAYIICFLLFIGVTAYLSTQLEGELNSDNFTNSQAIAFGNKPGMIILIVGAMSILSYLVYYRGDKYLYFRLFLILIISTFIVSIVWITKYYNKDNHYILSGFIFISFCIIMLLNSYLIYTSLGISDKTKSKQIILISIPILSLIGFIGIILGVISPIEENATQLLPSSETYISVIFTISVFTLGFF